MSELDAGEFPIGATLDSGRFIIRELLRGEPSRGMYRGIAATGDERMVLITSGTHQTVPAARLRDQLALGISGVTALRYIGPIEDRGGGYDALVEDEPEGCPVADHLGGSPLAPTAVYELAHGLAAVLRAAHAARKVIRHLRPELVFVRAGSSGSLELTGLAPRAEEFLRTAEPPRDRGAAMFRATYLAPELLALGPASPASDVFAFGALLVHLLSGQHPFPGDDVVQQVRAMHAGSRRPWSGPEELRDILDRTLAPHPAARPTLTQVMDALTRRLAH